ncbi:MAG TPA: hypothetical protein VFX61_01590 [Micromonosporaceae bacterium]|nr:hypothetical protein [Micromonosporaceae bacterium]
MAQRDPGVEIAQADTGQNLIVLKVNRSCLATLLGRPSAVHLINSCIDEALIMIHSAVYGHDLCGYSGTTVTQSVYRH